MLVDTKEENEKEQQGDIQVTNMFSKIGSNDMKSLKKYFESGESNIKEYAKAIEYTYNVLPQIYSSNTDELRQLNPNNSFASLGIGSSATSNNMMSSMMSTDVFYEMPIL